MATRREFLAASSGLLGTAFAGSLALPGAEAGGDSSANARAVVERLLGSRAGEFRFEPIPAAGEHPVFEVSAAGGRVTVRGSSAAAMCRGVYTYLRADCGAMATWSGSHLALPQRWPDRPLLRVVSPYRFVQYYNVCTFGYTTPFWDWSRWERELDWMALHGINMALAMDGQEAVWQRVWKQFGITPAELDRFFTGPAYLPWHRMGNLDYFEGPLPPGWINQKRDLQERILNRMRALGIAPVVPGFSGFVPEGFKRVFPGARTFTELWLREMPRHSKTLILDPRESDLYHEIGGQFIREYRRCFGPVEYYLADAFNELDVPVTAEHRYEELARFARNVYEGILAGDPNGIWVMQGWLFRNQPQFWDRRSVEAFLSGVPNDRMIVIDYSSDSNAQKNDGDPTAGNVWKDQQAFFGKRWINGILHTFGGNNNVKGNLALIAAQPAAVLASPAKGNLVGWGMDPEGTENNEVVFELMTDIGWSREKVDLDSWIPAYCRARYGGYPAAMAEAWRLLRASAYSWHGFGNTRHAWQSRPSLEPAALAVEAGPEFRRGVEQFLACAGTLMRSELYRNDLIEFVAQSAGGSVDRHLLRACHAHKAGNTPERDRVLGDALEMLNRIDALLNVRPDRRMETWVADARSWGLTPDEQAYYDSDARRLITNWGWPELYDYASRVWSGLIRDYYVPRWRAFFATLGTNRKYAMDVWEEGWLSAPWRPSPPRPVSDVAAECRAMLEVCRGWERDRA